MKHYRELPYADREEWLALRRRFIGGSDAAAAVGISPYKSPFTLYAEKIGAVEEFSGNLTTELGAYLEEFVARKWCEETGKQVRRKNRIIVNDLYPWACADVDRMIVGENAALEVKTTNSWPVMRAIRDGGDEFPDIYYAQCLHYMAIGGFDRVYLVVLAEGRELLFFTLERDQAEIDALMLAEKAFWAHVTDRVPPAVDGAKSTSEVLPQILPQKDEDRVDLTDLDGVLREYLALGAQIKTLKAAQDEAANKIKIAIGSHAGGDAPCAKVSWSTGRSSRFNKDLFLRDFAGRGDKYFTETETRTFRVTEKKKGA